MAYSIGEIGELKDKIGAALAAGRLSAWQTRFLMDIRDRIEKYGPDVRFSEKQLAKLYEIISVEKTQRAAVGIARSRPGTRRRRGGGLFAREGRWFARRLVRDASLLAVLTLGFFIYSYVQRVPWLSASRFFAAAERSYATMPIARSEFSVTDGDTIHIRGEAKGLRLAGFNTPETIDPQCPEERALGKRASARLTELIASASLELERIPCSCPPGTEGTDACNFARSCGMLRVNGRDVGNILISEGLAVPFVCGTTSCPPTPKPWCT